MVSISYLIRNNTDFLFLNVFDLNYFQVIAIATEVTPTICGLDWKI